MKYLSPCEFSVGEVCILVREPNNPYDKNAIRIDNVEGIKIGHVKAKGIVTDNSTHLAIR